MAGVERLLIEQIRVNVRFELYGVHVTQAEFIATGFLIAGLAGMAILSRHRLPGARAAG
jgi:phosphatidylglycerol:prolipoprotein diacylglycerol transferase